MGDAGIENLPVGSAFWRERRRQRDDRGKCSERGRHPPASHGRRIAASDSRLGFHPQATRHAVPDVLFELKYYLSRRLEEIWPRAASLSDIAEIGAKELLGSHKNL